MASKIADVEITDQPRGQINPVMAGIKANRTIVIVLRLAFNIVTELSLSTRRTVDQHTQLESDVDRDGDEPSRPAILVYTHLAGMTLPQQQKKKQNTASGHSLRQLSSMSGSRTRGLAVETLNRMSFQTR
ncbi:hypothetical protein BaRGS_00039165 [Batillaria attramentaria]|uniref:Uncharacterized protein n=1 Tax=Batillaria attramentaria TaxID=370345 RepID=A0ABD0J4T2_9CAEN